MRRRQFRYQYKNGICEHRAIVEAVLGRSLPPKSQIHHVNGDEKDNRACNLVLCPDQAYHALLHRRLRALKACGNANWNRCCFCGEYDDPGNVVSRHDKNQFQHPQCYRDYHNNLHHRRMDEDPSYREKRRLRGIVDRSKLS